MRVSNSLLMHTLLFCGTAASAFAAESSETLYLQAFVNGADQDLIVRVERTATNYQLTSGDLAELGLKKETLPPDAATWVDISALPGVRANYSALEQKIDLEIPVALLTPQLLGEPGQSEISPHSDTGLVLGYALHVQSDRTSLEQAQGRTLAPRVAERGARVALSGTEYAQAYDEKNKTATLSSEFRLFSPRGLFVNRGYTTADSEDLRYVREDSFWSYTGLDSMRNYLVGDFIGSSLTWTRALRLGGARVSRNFGVRPDLITYPLPAFGGTAVVPTAVDVYVNGARQWSGEARPGPFLVSHAPPLTGAGEVAIVYRDEAGRLITTTQPLYVDTRLLEEGLSDYDFAIGYPRSNFGSQSSDYGDDPEFVASLRHGVSGAFTLEAHAEVADALRTAGVGGLLSLSKFGVLSGAIAGSDGSGKGMLTSAGYQYITPRWSIDLYDRRTHDDYQDLGSLEGVPFPSRLTRGSVNVWFLASQSLGVNYVEQQQSDGALSRVTSLTYSGSWFRGRVSTYLSVFRDEEDPDGDGAYLTVNIGFGGGASGYTSASRYGDERTTTLGMSRPIDYDRGGFGWSAVSERGNEDYRRGHAQVDYRSRVMDLSVMATQTGAGENEQWTSALDASGALVYMRGGLFATRAIYDGFALVSTRGLPDVPVMRENRHLGDTNSRGYLLVPDLPAYRTSRIGIDLLQAPLDVSASRDQLMANPREFSGVVVEFPIERLRGATLVLVDIEQQPLPPGTPVTLVASGAAAVVGYGGQVFFPSLQERNRIAADLKEGRCEVDVTFDESQVMRTLGPFVCQPVESP